MIERLSYYPVWLSNLALALGRLSRPHGVSAYQLLWLEYHYSRGLPAYDGEVRRIAGLTGNKKWDSVRRELLDAGFTTDWRNPKWDASIATAERIYARGQKGGKKKAANAAEEAAMELDPDAVPF
jgi:hypothetical protein